MVTITSYAERTASDGTSFIALILQGELIMIQSRESGRYYATCKQCSIASTFSEPQAQALIGTSLPGTIEKVECAPYAYTIEETGEVLELDYRWEFVPRESPCRYG